MRLVTASGDEELAWEAVADRLADEGMVMIREGSVDEVKALLAGRTEPYQHPHDAKPGLTVIVPGPSCGSRDGWRRLYTGAAAATHRPQLTVAL